MLPVVEDTGRTDDQRGVAVVWLFIGYDAVFCF